MPGGFSAAKRSSMDWKASLDLFKAQSQITGQNRGNDLKAP